jgi:hypothetical protein
MQISLAMTTMYAQLILAILRVVVNTLKLFAMIIVIAQLIVVTPRLVVFILLSLVMTIIYVQMILALLLLVAFISLFLALLQIVIMRPAILIQDAKLQPSLTVTIVLMLPALLPIPAFHNNVLQLPAIVIPTQLFAMTIILAPTIPVLTELVFLLLLCVLLRTFAILLPVKMEFVSTTQLFAMTITLAQMIVAKSLMELLRGFLLLFNALDIPPVMDTHVCLPE